MTHHILVSDKLSENGLKVLRDAEGVEVNYAPGLDPAALKAAIQKADALIIRSATTADRDLLEAAPRLRLIGRAGIGVDNVDVAAASRQGIVVMNTPHGNAVTAAEHAISLVCSLARNIPQATASMKAGKWEKSKFQGRELSEKILGLVGLGNIGRIVAARAQGLRMKVIASDPMLTEEAARKLGIELVEFGTLLKRADIISIHTPLVASTHHLFNDAAFEQVKPGLLLVNAARGGIVDEAALLRALESGRVAGAGLDVFETEPVPADHPLLAHPNIVCTPHLGASTAEAQERVAVEIAEQTLAFLREGTVLNAVNLPSVSPEAAGKIAPYARLARRLGSLLAQLEVKHPSVFRVVCRGELPSGNARSLTYEALAGFLSVHADGKVNAVRAPYEAKERGIEVLEVADQAPKRFTNALVVEIEFSGNKRRAIGSLDHEGEPRLTTLDAFDVDALLDGHVMFLRNLDQPGVIGAVGSVLGQQNINVSRMQVGLDPKTKQAIAFWNIDGAIPSATLEAIRGLPHVAAVSAIALVDEA